VNRDNMPHENALFWVHGYWQDVKTKVRQHAVWHSVLLSLAKTRPTKAFEISHHIQHLYGDMFKRFMLL
jgi:hypothetical protein